MTRRPSISVVIPARNAEATIARVVAAVAEGDDAPEEVIVVDDVSTDATADVAERHGARVIRLEKQRYAGGARNRGWEEASGEVIVFLDADAVPAPGWARGLRRAVVEHERALIACARTFTARRRWGWVAHFEIETPFLPRGTPREEPTLSSFCLAVPADAPLRWHESYGGEDGLFCADALAAGFRLVFDPRFHAVHDHRRETFADLRRQQRRLVYGFARGGHLVVRQHRLRRLAWRVPVHYFLLLRLPVLYSRIRSDAELRSRFLRLLPWLVFGEWMLGISACRYLARRPETHEAGGTRAF
jgi:glycosyltransferase involved in cell wall biosynthesis